MIVKPKIIVTVNVLYYRLDYKGILQSFIWQTHDEIPELYRVHKFLNFWKTNIEAPISEVHITHEENPNWRNVIYYANQ